MRILYGPMLGLLFASSLGYAASSSEAAFFNEDDVTYTAAPADLPKGAMLAVMQGDPSKDEAVTIRLKFPADYRIPLHTHPTTETLTIISGSLRMFYGEGLEKNRYRTLDEGGFFLLPANTPHRISIPEETVVQLTTRGPFAINYLDPEDDMDD